MHYQQAGTMRMAQFEDLRTCYWLFIPISSSNTLNKYIELCIWCVLHFWEIIGKLKLKKKQTWRKCTWSPLLPSCFTATSILSAGSLELLMTPLKTHPKPPSPSFVVRPKFFVACFSSEKEKTLRLLALSDKFGNWLRPLDSELVFDTSWEFNSDPDCFISWSVNEDWSEFAVGVFGSSFLSPL